MKLKTKILICLIVLALFDMVIPVPFATILLIYILLERPPWFIDMVKVIYMA